MGGDARGHPLILIFLLLDVARTMGETLSRQQQLALFVFLLFLSCARDDQKVK